jgi:predicted branched-subunit amino acid permease
VPNHSRNASLKEGLKSSVPVALAFGIIFFSLGLMANAKNLEYWEAILLTATIFAGPSQSYVVDNQSLPLWTIAINILLLNFRFLLMSTLIVSLWQKRRLLAVPSLYFLTSGTYLISVVQKNIKDPWAFYITLAVTSYVVAVVSTAIGYHAWNVASDYKSILNLIAHIVIPIHFVCLTLKRKDAPVAMIATFIGFLVPLLFGGLIPKQGYIFVWILIAGLCVYYEGRASDV